MSKGVQWTVMGAGVSGVCALPAVAAIGGFCVSEWRVRPCSGVLESLGELWRRVKTLKMRVESLAADCLVAMPSVGVYDAGLARNAMVGVHSEREGNSDNPQQHRTEKQGSFLGVVEVQVHEGG